MAAKVDGHSLMEDVDSWMRIARGLRTLDSKIGRKGKINDVAFKDHGFPGTGTVSYWLYLPKNYNPRAGLSPVIFCLPDNKVWTDGKDYISQMWVERSEKVANDYIVVVPKPRTKGERWSSDGSMARAMITLRHVLGEFHRDSKRKGGSPYADPARVFIDGQDIAAIVAARFAEMFAGAVLRSANGRDTGRIDLRRVGGIAGLPAYCVMGGKNKKTQEKFAHKLKGTNGRTLFVEDDKLMGEADEIVKWMESVTDEQAGVRHLQPKSLDYTIHESSFQRHFWITVLKFDASAKPAPGFLAEANRASNVVKIDVTGVSEFEVFLNDAIVDLNKPLKVVAIADGQELVAHDGPVARSLDTLLTELVASNQPWRIYPAKVTVNIPDLLAAKAKADAAAKEKEGDKKGKEGTGVPASPAVG